MNKNNLCALIGLCGAVSNNGKTEKTDRLIRQVLLSGDEIDMTAELHQEKNRIAPNCAVCTTPCGNTSDYPAEKIALWQTEESLLKEKVIEEIVRITKSVSLEEELPEIIYRAISYIGYDLENKSYSKLLEEMKVC